MIYKNHRLRGFAWIAVGAIIAVLVVILLAFLPFLLWKGATPVYNGSFQSSLSSSTKNFGGQTAASSDTAVFIAPPSSTTGKNISAISNIMPANPESVPSSAQETASSSSAHVPAVPVPVPVAPSSTAVVSQSSVVNTELPPEMPINSDAIVGVLCYFNVTVTDSQNGAVTHEPQEEVRGSGVIIDSRGYILTNRHVIEQPEETTTATDTSGNGIPVTVDYSLDHCEVGQVAAGSHLPTVSEIQSLNPYIQVPVLGYTAQPVYISSTYGLSANEVDAADFAILTITGLTKVGPTFGVTSVPSSFPYVELFSAAQYLVPGTQVITYGFPGDVTAGQGNAFETLTMTGSVGTVSEIEVGDRFYADTPLVILTDLDVAHGRSGSPLFWRGYVVGLVTFYTGDNRTSSGSVASEAILKALRSTNYDPSYDFNFK